MDWKVAEAKQRLSEVLRLAAEEPQAIYKRDRLVAAVVDAGTFEDFRRWQARATTRSVGEAFAELRRIAAEEDGWELPTVERSDRSNAFAEQLADGAWRHQRTR